MVERDERIGLNEVLFRQVNERLRELGESFSHVAESSSFVCECGDVTCAEPIQMTFEEYEHVRTNAEWFAIRPSHELPQVETVVARLDGYDIVQKRPGGPAEIARAADPRS